ncbi:MAG: rhodanese-like domain-containing protein [Chitinophagales bacterium]
MGLFSFLFSNTSNAQNTATLLNSKDFKSAIEADKEAQVIDVRTAMEFNRGHFESAVNISFFDRDFAVQMEQFDKSKPIYLYCKSGNRSGKAARLLAKKGFEEIYDLKGGY